MMTMAASYRYRAAGLAVLVGLAAAVGIAFVLATAPAARAAGEEVEAGAQTAAAVANEDQETLARLIDYLNRIDTLKSRFVQVSSNGGYAEGDLYLDRPGRMRFEYDPPHPALLIANGVTLLY